MEAGDRAAITFRPLTSPGAGAYEVLLDDVPIGTIGRFQMAAGQFGPAWMATSIDGRQSTRFPSRAAAAAWLAGLVGPRDDTSDEPATS